MSDTTRKTQWGAGPEDWRLFSDQLGLREDLLPVVSNPEARISARSNMQALGKTPSQYNRDGEAVGVPKWTERKTTEQDIKRWMANSDLGICVQTRVVRAIDIDIEDGVQAQRVRDAIGLCLELQLPVRWRTGSGKCLAAFRMPGEFVKRIIRTAHGAIEFLATGQQFVAVGTHPKGERYVWEGIGEGIPELVPAQFEELWALLQSIFGIEPEITGKVGMRPAVARDAGSSRDDQVIEYVEAKGIVRSWERDGRVNVHCPWADEHTTDSGETATQWLPAGVGGFDQGHFKCLHAHCAGRGRDEFLAQIGFLRDEFEDVAPAQVQVTTSTGATVAVVAREDRPKPVFQRKRNGSIIANVVNVRRALDRADVVDCWVAWDNFRAEIMLAPWSEAGEAEPHLRAWRPFTDTDYTSLRMRLEEVVGFEAVGKQMIQDCVHWMAERQTFDSAIEWLEHRVPAWDGVPRVDTFFHRLMGAADTPYTRAVAAYLWTGLAGRVLEPGVKADMVPVLISGEGTGKTSGVMALAPGEEFYVEIDLKRRDDDISRAMRGKLIGELGELQGLQSRDRESILAWVVKRFEEWTPKYREFATRFARRLMLVGTTNNAEFLPNDGSMARRWLPLAVGTLDMATMVAEREQLWAEARDRFTADGVAWQAAHDLAGEVRDDHRVVDDWHEAIKGWLLTGAMDDPEGPARGWSPVTTADLLLAAIGIPLKQITRREQERAAAILKSLGYVRKKARVHDGRSAWAYAPTSACSFLREAGRDRRSSTHDLA